MSVPPRKVFFLGGGLNYNQKPDDLFLFYFFCNFHNYSIRYFLVFKKSFLNWVVFFPPHFSLLWPWSFLIIFYLIFFRFQSWLKRKKEREKKMHTHALTDPFVFCASCSKPGIVFFVPPRKTIPTTVHIL